MNKITYYLGVDVGTSYVKSVLLNDEKIVIRTIDKVESNPELAGKNAIIKTAEKFNLKEKQITKHIAGTGIGISKCKFIKNQLTDMLAVAKGVTHFISSARTLVDVGALSIKAISLIDGTGKIKDYSLNDRCAGGSGMFLELVAKALEMSLEEISNKPLKFDEIHRISSQCSIFGESEVIYLKNEGFDKIKIAGGVNDSVAGRTSSIVRRLDLTPDVVISGGVANNAHFVKCLSDRLNVDLKTIEYPSYVGALGAALIAKEQATRRKK